MYSCILLGKTNAIMAIRSGRLCRRIFGGCQGPPSFVEMCVAGTSCCIHDYEMFWQCIERRAKPDACCW
jgi:hypothetical protein